ncbi:MAG: hypothetical protein Kow0010_10020 [Dehalococcoidia bacterium]
MGEAAAAGEGVEVGDGVLVTARSVGRGDTEVGAAVGTTSAVQQGRRDNPRNGHSAANDHTRRTQLHLIPPTSTGHQRRWPRCVSAFEVAPNCPHLHSLLDGKLPRVPEDMAEGI